MVESWQRGNVESDANVRSIVRTQASELRQPLLSPAICEASANPLRVHCWDKLVKALATLTSMNRDD